MNRNNLLQFGVLVLLCGLALIGVASATHDKGVQPASETASKMMSGERLCGRGAFDVCDWRVRERRSNY